VSRRGELKEVQNLNLDFLKAVTCVTVSRDGKFLYATAFAGNVVAVFSRDPESGQIGFLRSNESEELDAAVSVRLSPNDRYAAVAAFRANSICLFRRSATDGSLALLDVAREGEQENDGLNFVIDAAFSPDNRFLYTAAAMGVGVFNLTEGKLKFVQCEKADDRLRGVRGVTLSPDGATIYAAAYISGTVGVLRRDKDSGKVEVVQLLADGQDGVETIEGAFRIAVSNDGRHVYLSSGRFKGDQAVTVFEAQADGKLKLLEAHVNGQGGFTGFEGGNTIAISPDGSLVYAVATLSDRLVRFRRDPVTGRLTFLGSQAVGANETPGASGLLLQPRRKVCLCRRRECQFDRGLQTAVTSRTK
jgi:6-phosphogluconolactonase (cycloisomerase 2 family)